MSSQLSTAPSVYLLFFIADIQIIRQPFDNSKLIRKRIVCQRLDAL